MRVLIRYTNMMKNEYEGSENESNTLFVGNLNEHTSKEELIKYFSKFGKVAEVNLIFDWTTGKIW